MPTGFDDVEVRDDQTILKLVGKLNFLDLAVKGRRGNRRYRGAWSQDRGVFVLVKDWKHCLLGEATERVRW